MTFVIFAANYLHLIIIGISAAVLITKKSLKVSYLRLAVISLPLSFFLAKTLGRFIDNPRPFVIEKVQPLIPHAATNGFPSDHTLLTMTLAAIIFVYNKRLGILLAILAFIVGYARVIAKIHHFVDIFGAGTIAAISVYLSFIIINKFFSNPEKRNAIKITKGGEKYV